MTTGTITKPLWRRLLLPLFGGGVAGFLVAFGFLNLTEMTDGAELSTSREIGGLAGAIYVITGFSVLVGVMSPGVGAKFLNVEDADELREQSRMLLLSGVAMVALGLALMLLALSGEGAFLPAGIGAVGTIALIVLSIVLSIVSYRHTDELQRALSSDAVASAFYLVVLVGGGWAMFAHLGYTAGPAPLDWLTLFAASLMVGTFWQTARRGLMLRGPN